MKGDSIRMEITELQQELSKTNYRSALHLRACRKRLKRLRAQLKGIAMNDTNVAKAQLKLI